MKLYVSIFGIAMAMVFTSCKKDNDGCFDKRLYEKHKNDACPADCRNLIGCDGKHYCNECEARRHGIRID